jgi:hypothetical protein
LPTKQSTMRYLIAEIAVAPNDQGRASQHAVAAQEALCQTVSM